MSTSQQYVSSPVSSPSVSAYPIQSQTQTYTENTQQFEDEDSGDANMEAGVFAKLHHIANVPFNSLSLGPNKLSYSVGRKTHNDIVIKRPYISGTHCTIEKNVSKNLVTIKDSSSNGTYVNGVNLKGAIRILYNNDIIAISPPSRVSHNTTPSPNMMASNNNNNANTPGNNNNNNNNNNNMQPQQKTVAIQFSISIPENLRPNTSHNGTTAQDVLFNTKYKYDETEQIGSGTFGSVHKCINKTTGEMFAVKVMDLAKLNGYGLDPEILKDEANLMLKIKNHHQHELISAMKSFDEFIAWRCERDFHSQSEFLKDDSGDVIVKDVYRLESLSSDIKRLASHIGCDVCLKRLNQSRSDSYRQYYSDKSREMVRRFFKEDIERFGYEF